MKSFELCEFHVVSCESGVWILDAEDKPFIFFPFAGRDPDFIEYCASSLVVNLDCGIRCAAESSPSFFVKKV